MRMNFERILLVAILLFSSFIFLKTPGTGDVADWLRLARNVDRYGIVDGYNSTADEYAHPPGMALLSFISTKISTFIGLPEVAGIKLSMYFFLLLTIFIIYVVTKNYLLCIISYVLLMINSLGLLYLDIYFTPFLILSLFFLKKKNILLTTIFYGLASMIKMQVIILMPFFALQIVNMHSIGELKYLDYKKITLNFILPYSLIFLTVLLIFGMPFISSFETAIKEDMLSGQATNVGWIITYFLHYIFPERFGSLESSGYAIRMIRGYNILLHMLKYSFFISYTIVFFKYFKQKEKSFEKFIIYASAAFLTYFILNKGVHENHLHIAVLLLLVLYGENKNYFIDVLIWGLLFNINMIIWYSYDGTGLFNFRSTPHSSYRIINYLDISLLFSFVCVVAYFQFIYKYIFGRNHGSIQN